MNTSLLPPVLPLPAPVAASRLAWLIDPKGQTARVLRASGAVVVVENFHETLTGEDVLPGFGFALSLLR